MRNYTRSLQQEIDRQTEQLQRWNEELERRVEAELARRTQQEEMLLHQYRLASMGEMIDAIAHQWRQPLMSINGLLLNLDRSFDLAKDRAYITDKINAIGSLTEHMSQTITDFRMLLRPDKTYRWFEVEGAITQVLELMAERLSGIEVTHTASGPIRWRGYPNELHQWLMIVLGNAVEALHHRRVVSPRIRLTAFVRDEHLQVSVADNAGGIDPVHLKRIFDPYFTTKKHGGGTGLGLYIARLIVERNMRGRMEAIPIEGGMDFRLRIPHPVEK
jgi:C4-dicarboxylate-specific signal transduction histidine kinase